MVALVLHLKGKWKRKRGCSRESRGSSMSKGPRAKGRGGVSLAGACGVLSGEGGVRGEASS